MHRLALPFAILLSSVATTAQEKVDVGEVRLTADAAVASQDWPAAIAAFRKLVAVDPTDGRAWHMLGYSLHGSGALDAALEAHLKATEFPAVAPVASYNAACVYALRGDQEKALEWLEKAAERGFTGAAHIAGDTDMDTLRDLPRFKRALQRIEQNQAARPAVQTFAVTTDRKSTRVVLFAAGGSQGGASISYGQPDWNAKYDEHVDSAKLRGRRWRFGKDEWTTLDNSVPLTLGQTRLEPGVYYLTLARSTAGDFVLTAIDPKAVHAFTIDPYVAHLTAGGQDVVLEHTKVTEVTPKLTITLQPERGQVGKGMLNIAFGPHRLSAPFALEMRKAEQEAAKK